MQTNCPRYGASQSIFHSKIKTRLHGLTVLGPLGKQAGRVQILDSKSICQSCRPGRQNATNNLKYNVII